MRAELRRLALFALASIALTVIEVSFVAIVHEPRYVLASIILFSVIVTGLAVVTATWETVYRPMFKSVRLRYYRPPIKKVLDPYMDLGLWPLIRGLPPLKVLVERLAERLKVKLIEAGYPVHPLFYASTFVLASLIMSPLACIGLWMLIAGNPLGLVMIIAPLVPLMTPMVDVNVRRSNRANDVANEYPYFLIYASLVHKAGVSLFDAYMKILGRRDVFKVMEREARILRRFHAFLVHSPVEALEWYGRTHPNNIVRSVTLGYTSILRSGGDVVSFLEKKAAELLERERFRWRRFVESAAVYGDIAVLVLTLLPAILVLGALVFSQSSSLFMLMLYAAVVLPIFTFIFVGFIHFTQPRTYNTYSMGAPLAYSCIVLVVTAALMLWLNMSPEVTLGVVCLCTSMPMAVAFQAQYMEVVAIEKALPQFLRDLTEYVKIGYDVVQALIIMPMRRSYNRIFDRIALRISSLLRMNTPLSVISSEIETRSWYLKYVLFLISEIASTGGGSPAILEELTTTIESSLSARNGARSQLRTYVLILYMAPLLVGALIALTSVILEPLSAMTAEIPLISVSMFEQVVALSKLVTIEIGVAAGFIAAKLYDQSALSFRHLVAGSIIGLASVTLMPYIVSNLMGMTSLQLGGRPPAGG